MASWLPSWRGRDQYSSLPSSGATVIKGRSPRAKLVQAGLAFTALVFLLGIVSMRDGSNPYIAEEPQRMSITYTTQTMLQPYWGWTEQQGWREDRLEGLADLGEIAEDRYRLGFEAGESGTRE